MDTSILYHPVNAAYNVLKYETHKTRKLLQDEDDLKSFKNFQNLDTTKSSTSSLIVKFLALVFVPFFLYLSTLFFIERATFLKIFSFLLLIIHLLVVSFFLIPQVRSFFVSYFNNIASMKTSMDLLGDGKSTDDKKQNLSSDLVKMKSEQKKSSGKSNK